VNPVEGLPPSPRRQTSLVCGPRRRLQWSLWLKRRSEREATRVGRPGAWRHEDMERAAFLSNQLPRRGGLSPQARWDARAVLGPDVRVAFLKTVEDLGLSASHALSALQRRQVGRHSIRRALVARGYISFRRRTIPLPEKLQKADTR